MSTRSSPPSSPARAAPTKSSSSRVCSTTWAVTRYDQSLVADTTEWTAVGSSARRHHEVGAELLAPSVPARVTWCVRMHADAKRYLCAAELDYVARLSPVSRRRLELQGGIMSPSAAARFAEHP